MKSTHQVFGLLALLLCALGVSGLALAGRPPEKAQTSIKVGRLLAIVQHQWGIVELRVQTADEELATKQQRLSPDMMQGLLSAKGRDVVVTVDGGSGLLYAGAPRFWAVVDSSSGKELVRFAELYQNNYDRSIRIVTIARSLLAIGLITALMAVGTWWKKRREMATARQIPA